MSTPSVVSDGLYIIGTELWGFYHWCLVPSTLECKDRPMGLELGHPMTHRGPDEEIRSSSPKSYRLKEMSVVNE